MDEKRSHAQVKIIAAITAACLLGDSMLYVVLPIHGSDLGIDSFWEIGLLLSINRFIRLPLNPIVGWLYKRISLRHGILFAVILAALTTASYGIHSFWILLLMRCIWGLAWTFLRLGSYFLILEISTVQHRGYHMGMYNGIYRLGSLAGMLLGGLLADLYGITIVTLLFSAFTSIAIFIAWRWVPQFENAQSAQPIAQAWPSSFWKQRDVLWILFTGLFIAMLYQGTFTSTLSRFIDSRYPALAIGTFTIGAATLAGILQALRWSWEPWLAPWTGNYSDGPKGRKPILLISLLAASLMFGLTAIHFSIFIFIMILIGIQITATFLTTVADALAADIAMHAQKKVEIMTSYSIATDLGAAIGPLLGYFLINNVGITHVYLGSAFILFILFLGSVLFFRETRYKETT